DDDVRAGTARGRARRRRGGGARPACGGVAGCGQGGASIADPLDGHHRRADTDPARRGAPRVRAGGRRIRPAVAGRRQRLFRRGP
ncbi:hypothetical protein DKX15_19395, partial [Enterococcus faecium]